MNLLRKLRSLFGRENHDTDMAAEMRAHLDAQTQRNIAAGMSEADARAAARRQFGGVAQIQERARHARGWMWPEQAAQDLRYATRQLRRSPAFALVAILTLGVGIGATTAIFTIADAVLWRPLPYAEAQRLVTSQRLNGETLRIWEAGQQILDRVETHLPRSMVLTGGSSPTQISVDAVSPGLFELFGRQPALGRPFSAGDAAPGNENVVLLSHAFWQRHFAGSTDALGKRLTLDDQTYTVIGVMPRDFSFPRARTELWMPLAVPITAADLRRRVEMVGRLRPGLDFAAAQQAVAALNQRLNQSHPQARDWDVNLYLLDATRVNPGPQRMMLLVFGAVGFVLLIACANVANLLLVRATMRQREFAVRAALGAGRRRLIRQVLTESLFLAGVGAVGGLICAHWAVKAIWSLAPTELTWLTINEVTVDWRVLGFTTVLAATATVLCGLVPALRAAHSAASQNLGLNARATTGSRQQSRWQSSFVIAQAALAFVLLVGAALLMRGFVRLNAVDPGFDRHHLIALTLQLPTQRYRTAEQREHFHAELRERIIALPGVTATIVAAGIPPRTGGFMFSAAVEIEGRSPEKLGASELLPFNAVEDDYFRVLRIPLLRGRTFDQRDVRGAPPTIVINEQMARRFWPGGDPIGQRLRFDPRQPWQTVIGVAGDVKMMSLTEANDSLEYYRSIRQDGYGSSSTVAVRTGVDPAPILPLLREQVAALDGRLPIAGLSTVDELMTETLAIPRFSLVLMSIFAGAAIVLAAVGLYGVMSCTVAQRTREIGVRIALGGSPTTIAKLVAGRGLVLIGSGLLIGGVAAIGLTRYLKSILFEVSPLDPATFGGVAAMLGLIGLLACWLPARRAAKVDPVVALRAE